MGDLVPALMVDNIILNVASYHPGSTYQHNFRFPNGLDIAIAPMTAYHWSLLQDRKGKAAIDLDAWEEPDWPHAGTLSAVGYFNEEKYELKEKVATPMGFVTAELASSIGPQHPTFTLSSLLEDAHGHVFSGMSGGPDFLPISQDKMLPVGIVFGGGA